MKVTIEEKHKKELFVSLFQLLKNSTNALRIAFKEDHMYIQGMDKSHICLFDIKITSSWFTSYEKNDEDAECICIDTNIFFTVMSMCSENHVLVLEYDNDPDHIQIQWIHDKNKKGEFDKIFNLTLLDIESDYFEIPEVDYQAEFSINSKKINEIMTQLTSFGDIMNIKCNEENVTLISSGLNGEMKVLISVDDLTEYSITEDDEELNLFFGLTYLQKMCIHTKLSSEIGFSFGNNFPMKIKYDLGEDSHCVFYLAPKSDD